MNRPIVGVVPLYDEEKESIWMLPGYMEGLRQAGAIPLILPFASSKEEVAPVLAKCDGFLLTGGHDVSPALYGEKPSAGVVCCSLRDEIDAIVLEEALQTKKPLLGICRGIQFLNAYLGGTLYQDIPSQCPSEVNHHQSAPYDVPIHEVRLLDGTPLADCLKKSSLKVNSYHHQAVKRLGENLVAMAVAPDGLIEAAYLPSHPFLWAVQWHPEFSYRSDEDSQRIFAAFVEAMKR